MTVKSEEHSSFNDGERGKGFLRRRLHFNNTGGEEERGLGIAAPLLFAAAVDPKEGSGCWATMTRESGLGFAHSQCALAGTKKEGGNELLGDDYEKKGKVESAATAVSTTTGGEA